LTVPDDGTQVGPLLDQVTDPVASVTGDGAYDQDAVYAAVAERHPDAAVIVPPRTTAVPSGAAEVAPTQRDRHLQCITEKGRMAWQPHGSPHLDSGMNEQRGSGEQFRVYEEH
jgi:hypothetical protein